MSQSGRTKSKVSDVNPPPFHPFVGLLSVSCLSCVCVCEGMQCCNTAGDVYRFYWFVLLGSSSVVISELLMLR